MRTDRYDIDTYIGTYRTLYSTASPFTPSVSFSLVISGLLYR